MRTTLGEAALSLTPGVPGLITVEVVNTLEAIDGLQATVVGVEGLDVVADPPLLPLFPDGAGRITLRISAPLALPAGTYPAEVQVTSSVTPDEIGRRALELHVRAAPGAALAVVPPVRSGRRRATYTIICENTGNTPLELTLASSDPERVLRQAFSPPAVSLPVGGSTGTRLAVRAHRRFFGSEIPRALTIVGTSPAVEVQAVAQFRQRPVIPRGVRTAVILGAIVALWAGVFLVGLSKAFARDPQTKAVPPSFYVAAGKGSPAKSADGTSLGVLQVADSSDAPPAGAIPKSGLVEGIGGTVAGQVLAQSTGQGVGRITIEAVRDTPQGPSLVASAASDVDGSYSLAGLLPGNYKLLFTAQGYQDLWYPAATSSAGATPVAVGAMGQTAGIDATIDGLPGSITGHVDTGLSTPVPVTITVLPGQGTTTTPIAQVVTDGQGNYTVPNLPTPGSYDLSLSAPGYQVSSDVEQLSGGDARVANTVRLSAGVGEIDGTVTDGTSPLGGVAISATTNGQTSTSATPTSGPVGHFELPSLATPATYLLTFTKTGFGTQTVAINLGAGQIDSSVAVALVGGTGTVSGQVFGPGAAPLGGAMVTVNGGPTPVTTATLTAGTVGDYVISGLSTPGDYTVTFSLAGYAPQTLPVNLASGGLATGVDATLSPTGGTITGTIISGATGSPPLGGVTVTVTDGVNTRSTTSASAPPGGYTVQGLAPGAYSVTFTLSGYVTQAALVVLTPGQTATQNVALAPVGA